MPRREKMTMGKYRFALAPLLEHRRLKEERARRWVAECAEACARAHRMWEQAVEQLQLVAREAAAVETLERKARNAWQTAQRRRDEREEDDARRY
jgi:flagellar biosynthesis chaperone FliJ